MDLKDLSGKRSDLAKNPPDFKNVATDALFWYHHVSKTVIELLVNTQNPSEHPINRRTLSHHKPFVNLVEADLRKRSVVLP